MIREARPVGAARTHRCLRADKIQMIALTIMVLPRPAPPVRMRDRMPHAQIHGGDLLIGQLHRSPSNWASSDGRTGLSCPLRTR